MFAGRGVGLVGGLGPMNLSQLSRARSARQYSHALAAARSSSASGSKKASPSSAGGPPPPSRQSIGVKSPMDHPQTGGAGGAGGGGGGGGSEEEKKKLVLSKEFSRRTCWLACRATVFGFLLVLAGVAMSTIGYYNDYFAMEFAEPDGAQSDGGGGEPNSTAAAMVGVVNPTKKFQFQSLAYIGPVVMGAGAFILMMACVTTLESRDRQARIQAQLEEAERAPLSRVNTLQKSHHSNPPPSATDGGGPAGAAVPPPPPAKSSSAAPGQLPPSYKPKSVLKSSSSSATGAGATPFTPGSKSTTGGRDGASTTTSSSYQPAELMAVASVGVVNRSFTRDDSKTTTSKPDTDSGPSGTTTTTLTWSRNGGPKCETDVVCKFPSASCIEQQQHSVTNGSNKRPDERALLQRFLEDQSRLVEDRLLSRRITPPPPHFNKELSPGDDSSYRSVSLDGSAAKIVLHSSSTSGPRRNIVAAEVHHAGDASPRFAAAAGGRGMSSPPHFFANPSTSTAFHEFDSPAFGHDRRLRAAPVVAPESSELFSPMSIGPDTPAVSRHRSASQVLAMAPPAAPSRSQSPEQRERSVSGSYVTVFEGSDDLDDPGASVDLFNANSTTAATIRVYNTFTDAYQSNRPNPIPNWSVDGPAAGMGLANAYPQPSDGLLPAGVVAHHHNRSPLAPIVPPPPFSSNPLLPRYPPPVSIASGSWTPGGSPAPPSSLPWHPPRLPRAPNANNNYTSTDPTNRKLYDSVFLTENLRQIASSSSSTSMNQPESIAIIVPPLNQSIGGTAAKRSETSSSSTLCKDWTEMNANYLRNQQKL